MTQEMVHESEDPLKMRMMDSPPVSNKESKKEIFELRETVYDYKSKESNHSDDKRKIKSENKIMVKEEHKNIFKTANDRINQKNPKQKHEIEFGELDKMKSERDLQGSKQIFNSLNKTDLAEDKSYKVIQNKNSIFIQIFLISSRIFYPLENSNQTKSPFKHFRSGNSGARTRSDRNSRKKKIL